VYDNNGNVTQKTTDGTTTTYVYDYANRLTALGVLGATTTYAYDWAGNRVSQTGTSTTFIYPFKWYSVASSTGTGAKFATTTDYVFNGDSLVATIDQETASGNATGTAKTRYVHPDHLGSTNVVTDENGNVVQTLDFYPYGGTRISVATSTNEKRQFIGQFTDDSSLSYLNTQFYDSARGQFISQDPVFLADPKRQDIKNPQSLNSYSYANDNPIVNKDPSGRCGPVCIGLAALLTPDVVGDPVFNPNGSISSTPQQAGVSFGGFVGQMLAGSEEGTLLNGAKPEFTSGLIESIGVNTDINEVTSLPNRIPKGAGIGIALFTLGGISWLMSGVNGWDDNPTNLDVLKAYTKKILGNDGSKTLDTNNFPRISGVSAIPGTYMSARGSQSYQPAFSPFNGQLGLPAFVSSAASRGYGSSGSAYTSFVAPNAFSACGTLCR
jgi:RHS repeat-associated protein